MRRFGRSAAPYSAHGLRRLDRQAAGSETEHWLTKRFGGEELQIPLLETTRQAEHRRQMEAVAAAEGVSANELAQRLGVHRRTIQRLRQLLREQAGAA